LNHRDIEKLHPVFPGNILQRVCELVQFLSMNLLLSVGSKSPTSESADI